MKITLESVSEYAQKAYDLLPTVPKKFLKDQAPMAKKQTHKLMNLMQNQLAYTKKTMPHRNPGRVWKLRREALANLLLSADLLIKTFDFFEREGQRSVVLDPVPHHQFDVIPDRPKARPATKTASRKTGARKIKRTPPKMMTKHARAVSNLRTRTP